MLVSYLPVCSGDCPKHRLAEDGRSLLCAGWQKFYAHALGRLRTLCEEVATREG